MYKRDPILDRMLAKIDIRGFALGSVHVRGIREMDQHIGPFLKLGTVGTCRALGKKAALVEVEGASSR